MCKYEFNILVFVIEKKKISLDYLVGSFLDNKIRAKNSAIFLSFLLSRTFF